MFLFSCHLRKNSLRSRERVSHWAFVAGSSSVALSLPSFLHVFGSCFNQPPLDELVLRSLAWQVIEWCSHNPSCTTETCATWSFAELCRKIFWGIVSESSTSRYKLQSLRLHCKLAFWFVFIVIGLILFPLENLDPAARCACEVDLFRSLHLCCVLRTLFFHH